MKKTLIAALASLMLAGTISAVSGAAMDTTSDVSVMVGEGSAPIPSATAPAHEAGDAGSSTK